MREARLQAAVRLGATVSQDRMAELVSAELRRLGVTKTLSQSSWSQYEADVSEPSLAVLTATANVSGLDAGYLAFGAASVQLDPGGADQPLTSDTVHRARVRRDDVRERGGPKKRGA